MNSNRKKIHNREDSTLLTAVGALKFLFKNLEKLYTELST